MEDAYGAKMWDIEPAVQVASIREYKKGEVHLLDDAIFEKGYFLASPSEPGNQSQISTAPDHKEAGENSEDVDQDTPSSHSSEEESDAPKVTHSDLKDDDVVILDGYYTATVHWDKFRRVWHEKRLSLKRRILHWMLRLNIFPFLVGIILAGIEAHALSSCRHYSGSETTIGDISSMNGFAALFIIYSIGVNAAASLIIRTVHGGKFWGMQAWIFGFEGHLHIEEIGPRYLVSIRDVSSCNECYWYKSFLVVTSLCLNITFLPRLLVVG